jgi:hypothetical protein
VNGRMVPTGFGSRTCSGRTIADTVQCFVKPKGGL